MNSRKIYLILSSVDNLGMKLMMTIIMAEIMSEMDFESLFLIKKQKIIMRFELAPDIKEKIESMLKVINYEHLDGNRIICMRSYGSKSKAVARIWGLSRVWQKALKVKSHYIIEVIHPRFDKLSKEDQEKTLLHELLHIPKKFSGGLVPHKCFGKRIDKRRVDELYKKHFKKGFKFW